MSEQAKRWPHGIPDHLLKPAYQKRDSPDRVVARGQALEAAGRVVSAMISRGPMLSEGPPDVSGVLIRVASELEHWILTGEDTLAAA